MSSPIMFVRAKSTSYSRWPGVRLGVQLSGFGVHEVGGELAGVAPKQRVRQGDVAPIEADEVQAHEQQRERVDEATRRVLAHREGKERAVGEGELQVLGDEHRVELFAVHSDAARDDRNRVDRRVRPGASRSRSMSYSWWATVSPISLTARTRPGQVHEAHDVAGNAARQGSEKRRRPLLQRNVPREVEERGLGRGSRNVQSHALILSSLAALV